MALVDYASSNDDEEEEEVEEGYDVQTKVDPPAVPLVKSSSPRRGDEDVVAKELKRKRNGGGSSELPPLPSKFHDLYASTARLSTRDDPSLHGGRKRVTPHIEGNWPTHLYIEWYPSTTENAVLSKVISTLKDATPKGDAKLHSFLTSDLGAPLPLHISLSRSIGFSTEQKDAFLSSLEHAIKTSGIRPFNVFFSSLDWVPNFEKTRWFLVLRLGIPSGNELNKILHVCNNVVQEYKKPPLYAKATVPRNYQTPRKRRNAPGSCGLEMKMDWTAVQDVSTAFHISIAWALEAPEIDLLDATKSMADGQLEDVKDIVVKVREIKSKLGNVVTNILFQRNVMETKGLFGI